jgi:hypothetical protein
MNYSLTAGLDGVGVTDSLHFVSDVLAGVDEEDRSNVTRFATFLEDWVKSHGLSDKYKLPDLVEYFGTYDLSTLNKEGTCLQALWVIFLRIMRKNLEDDSRFKYKNMAEFLAEYDGEFNNMDTTEQVKLFHTANWMKILFSMVAAKKNKGLAVHVIPKLVEGFSIKYITGSGQTKATADRVRIFEHEGNVKPFQRGKWKNNDDSTLQDDGDGERAVMPKKTKKEKGNGSEDSQSSSKRLKQETVEINLSSHGGPLDFFGRGEKPIESVDFTECLRLLRSNSQTVKPSSDVPDMERHKSIDSVDFAECLKLLRTNSYNTRPPELSRDWSNSSIGFLTDSLLLAGDSAFPYDHRTEITDGLSLLNEAANQTILPMSSLDCTLSGNDELEFNLSNYNQLVSAPKPIKRSTSNSLSWRANQGTDPTHDDLLSASNDSTNPAGRRPL